MCGRHQPTEEIFSKTPKINSIAFPRPKTRPRQCIICMFYELWWFAATPSSKKALEQPPPVARWPRRRPGRNSLGPRGCYRRGVFSSTYKSILKQWTALGSSLWFSCMYVMFLSFWGGFRRTIFPRLRRYTFGGTFPRRLIETLRCLFEYLWFLGSIYFYLTFDDDVFICRFMKNLFEHNRNQWYFLLNSVKILLCSQNLPCPLTRRREEFNFSNVARFSRKNDINCPGGCKKKLQQWQIFHCNCTLLLPPVMPPLLLMTVGMEFKYKVVFGLVLIVMECGPQTWFAFRHERSSCCFFFFSLLAILLVLFPHPASAAAKVRQHCVRSNQLASIFEVRRTFFGVKLERLFDGVAIWDVFKYSH